MIQEWDIDNQNFQNVTMDISEVISILKYLHSVGPYDKHSHYICFLCVSSDSDCLFKETSVLVPPDTGANWRSLRLTPAK